MAYKPLTILLGVATLLACSKKPAPKDVQFEVRGTDNSSG